MGMYRMSTAELRVFAAVADELNLSRAATRLGIGQPSVSRALIRLEQHLGVRLAERTTRAVTLTAAGLVLHRQAHVVLDALSAAERLTRRAAEVATSLLVGCKPDGDAGLLPAVLERFATDLRAVPVALTMGAPEDLLGQLRRGELDVGLLQGPFDHSGLDHELLLTEPRLLAAAHCDPLTSLPAPGLSDIPPGRMIRWPAAPEELDRYYRGLDAAAERPGDTPLNSPTTAPQARDLAEALRLVELDRAVTLVPASVANRYRDRQLRYVPVDGVSPAPLSAVWAAGSRSPQVAAFVHAATTAALAGPTT